MLALLGVPGGVDGNYGAPAAASCHQCRVELGSYQVLMKHWLPAARNMSILYKAVVCCRRSRQLTEAAGTLAACCRIFPLSEHAAAQPLFWCCRHRCCRCRCSCRCRSVSRSRSANGAVGFSLLADY